MKISIVKARPVYKQRYRILCLVEVPKDTLASGLGIDGRAKPGAPSDSLDLSIKLHSDLDS